MEQDQRGPDQAKDHVQAEPECHRPQSKRHALAQGIEQQQQHQASADDTEPISGAAVGHQILLVTCRPSNQQNGGENCPKYDRRSDRQRPRRILRKSRCRRPREASSGGRATIGHVVIMGSLTNGILQPWALVDTTSHRRGISHQRPPKSKILRVSSDCGALPLSAQNSTQGYERRLVGAYCEQTRAILRRYTTCAMRILTRVYSNLWCLYYILVLRAPALVRPCLHLGLR